MGQAEDNMRQNVGENGAEQENEMSYVDLESSENSSIMSNSEYIGGIRRCLVANR